MPIRSKLQYIIGISLIDCTEQIVTINRTRLKAFIGHRILILLNIFLTGIWVQCFITSITKYYVHNVKLRKNVSFNDG